jgi:hypothetical protein
MRIPNLGRNLHGLAKGRTLARKPLTEDPLACSGAVRIRGVEQPKTYSRRMIQQGEGLFVAVASRTQLGRRADPAEIAAAEPNLVDVAPGQHP